MKYYRIKKSFKVGDEIVPQMNGTNVKGKNVFFDNGSFGPNKFCDKPIAFDYLVPKYISEEDEDKTPNIISNYHGWWGEGPWGGWLNVVSKELKEILEQFNFGPHKFYPAKVLHEGNLHSYFVFQIYDDFYQGFIDFDKTSYNNIYDFKKLNCDEKIVKKFSNYDEAEDFFFDNHDGNMSYERAVVKPEFREVDFVTWYKFGDLVSERLKNAIEEAGITGIDFIELPIPIEFSDEINCDVLK